MKKFLLIIAISILLAGCGAIAPKSTKPNAPVSGQTQQQQQGQPSPTAQASTQASTQVAQAQTVTETAFAQWVDLKDDKVGPTGLTPDGKPDGHFHLTLSFPEQAKIKYIILRYQGFGEHIQWEWVYNTSLQPAGAPIGVFMNNAQVQRGTDVGLEVPTACQLDLYVPELNNENGLGTFKFEKGQTINVQVTGVNASGNTITQEADAAINL